MMSARGLLSDLAGIITCSTPDSRIRFNLVRDVTRRDYGGWGIYPDEGSHDLLIQKNLVFRCQDGALFAHHNRNITAENNILAFNCAAQIERGGIGGFGTDVSSQRRPLQGRSGCRQLREWKQRSRRVRCSNTTSIGTPPANRFYSARRPSPNGKTMGQDQNSLIADPLFVDPGKWNFPVAPRLTGSPDRLRTVGLLNCGPPVAPGSPK